MCHGYPHLIKMSMDNDSPRLSTQTFVGRGMAGDAVSDASIAGLSSLHNSLISPTVGDIPANTMRRPW